MKYYVLSQSNSAYPANFISAVLFDAPYPNTAHVSHGDFPWYAIRPSDISPIFTENMILVSSESNHNFDARRISTHIYITSNKFISACEKLGVEMVDHKTITIHNKAGRELFNNEFSAVIFNEIDISLAADESSQLIYNYRKPCRIKKLIIRNEFSSHLFKFKNMHGSSNTLICSEKFRSMVDDNLKGVDFLDIESTEWPRVKII